MPNVILPSWPAPTNIRAFITTRQGGVSLAPYDSFNLALHVDDNAEHVQENRAQLIQSLQIPSAPIWLTQTHSTNVIDITEPLPTEADGAYCRKKQTVCAILTADCLPVLFCSSSGDEIAATHAGWRGLCHGILENTVKRFTCHPSQLIAWLGPAIGPKQFEVGREVKSQFEAVDPHASAAFTLIDHDKQKYLANIYLLAKQRLAKLGVTQIFGEEYCTYSQCDLFYSYRREKKTGRMASIIWFE